MHDLDPIDYRLLASLQRDARVTQAQLAARVGLSQAAIADRLRRLEERGAILGYHARLDPRALGQELRAFVGVSVDHPRWHRGFAARVKRLPEVLECHRVAGADSYLLKVMTTSTETLDRLLSEKVRTIPGVTRTHTTVVLSAIKEDGAVPVPEPTRSRRRPRAEKAS